MSRIRNVSNIPDFIAEVKQVSIDHVKRNIGSCMAKMAFAAHGRAANVHAHVTGSARNEFFLLAAIGIVNF
jgi:hypothetical protein